MQLMQDSCDPKKCAYHTNLGATRWKCSIRALNLNSFWNQTLRATQSLFATDEILMNLRTLISVNQRFYSSSKNYELEDLRQRNIITHIRHVLKAALQCRLLPILNSPFPFIVMSDETPLLTWGLVNSYPGMSLFWRGFGFPLNQHLWISFLQLSWWQLWRRRTCTDSPVNQELSTYLYVKLSSSKTQATYEIDFWDIFPRETIDAFCDQ